MKYHNINVSINSKYEPSYFSGSMIRGAFGYALKKVTCINPSYKCEGCFSEKDCLYYSFYEKKNSFHNYRFKTNLGSKKFDFELYIFNEAIKSLPYILSAIEMVLVENGLTKHNYKFENFTIKVDDSIVYKNREFLSLNNFANSFQVDTFCQNIKIKFLTPIRIKKNNTFLKDNIDLEDILRSIYQREEELEGRGRAYKLIYTPTYKNILKALYYKPLLRNSNRQNKRMRMDGIMGEMLVTNIDKESYRLLKLGEIIGVGKQTVMGLGNILIEEI